MEYVVIRFGDRRPVLISGVPCGFTNELIQVEAGTHRISLGDSADCSPALQKVVVRKTTVLTPMTVDFQMQGPLSLSEDPDVEPTSKKEPRAPKKATPKKATPKKTTPKKTTPKKPNARRKSPKKAAPKKAARSRASDKGKPRHAS